MRPKGDATPVSEVGGERAMYPLLNMVLIIAAISALALFAYLLSGLYGYVSTLLEDIAIKEATPAAKVERTRYRIHAFRFH